MPYLSQVAENGTPIVAACVMVVAEALLAVVGVYAVLLAFGTLADDRSGRYGQSRRDQDAPQ